MHVGGALNSACNFLWWYAGGDKRDAKTAGTSGADNTDKDSGVWQTNVHGRAGHGIPCLASACALFWISPGLFVPNASCARAVAMYCSAYMCMHNNYQHMLAPELHVVLCNNVCTYYLLQLVYNSGYVCAHSPHGLLLVWSV